MSEWDKTVRGLEAIGAEKQGIRNVNCERIGSSDGLDALREKWERRASWYDEEPNGDGKAALIRQQIRELRACAESASNGKISDVCPPLTQPTEKP